MRKIDTSGGARKWRLTCYPDTMTVREPWNRCDDCGRFIALDDFDKGAVRRLIYPDSELTRETYETLCRLHGEKQKWAGYQASQSHWERCLPLLQQDV